MQQLAAALTDGLLTPASSTSTSADTAAACRALLPSASSIRIAVLVTRDVLTVTGNLAAPGPVAMSLIPSTSAAGRCATHAAPQLVDGHITPRSLRGAAACRGICKSTLYVPIVDDGQCGTAGGANHHEPLGCLVVAFRCSQHSDLLRRVGHLAELAAALATTLPAAVTPLRQIMPAVLAQSADPAAANTISSSTAAKWGAAGVKTAAAVVNVRADTLGSIAATAAPVAGGHGTPAYSKSAAAADSSSPQSAGSGSTSSTDFSPTAAAATDNGRQLGETILREAKGKKAAQPMATVAVAEQGWVASSPANFFWLQYDSMQKEAAFGKWYAARNVQWDTCVFAVCLAFLVTRMLRPSAHALHAMPVTSAVVVGITLAALGLATGCRSWYLARRELICMLVWGCMAHLALALARAPSAGQSPAAMSVFMPLWTARMLVMEAALLCPLTFRVRFVHALPITVLKCLATLSYVPQVLGCSVHAGMTMGICTFGARLFQVLAFLVVPVVARHHLEARLRKEFEADESSQHTAIAAADPPPALVAG